MTTLEDVTRLLPDYDLGPEIGRGEFGVVWQARHRQLDREVAVKQLAGLMAGDPAHAARFRREAQLLATLDHPHVVRMFDYREEGSSRLLVMELLTGGTLADRRAAGLTLAPAVAAVMAAASGLHHVHERGVLHRDVKPENLMFDGGGVLKVTDFGIARDDSERATSVHVTRAGEFFGTPAYIAPEQAAPSLGGGWPEIGRAADEYSLAAVLYEMISGRLTHDPSGGWVALCHARMNEEARPLTEWVPALPEGVDDVVLRALARDPAERYPSVEAFAVALGDSMRRAYGDGWYADSDVTIREPGAIRDAAQPTRPVRPAPSPAPAGRGRRRKLAMLGVVVALASGAGAYLAIDGPSGGGAAPLPLALRSEWSVKTGDRVFASPVLADGAVVVGSEDSKIYGLDPATGRKLWPPFTTGGAVWASAAASGATAYVGSYDRSLYAIDVTTGSLRWKRELDAKIVSTAAIAGDDVIVGARNLVARVAATGDTGWSVPTSAGVQSSPAVSGGVVVAGAQDGSVYAATVADGALVWRYRAGDAVAASPVVSGAVVYVASLDGRVTALDLQTGRPRWTRTLGATVKSTPLVVGDRLVVGTVDGRLVALRTTDGTPGWTFRATGAIVSSPRSLGPWVVVGSNGGDVDAIVASTGTLAGRLHVGGPVLSSPLVLGDRVVVGSDDGHVYAIGGFR